MKKHVRLLTLVLLAGAVLSCTKTLTLASGDRSNYIIVIPSQATEMEQKAAAEFQRLFQLSSSVILPIEADTLPAQAREIIIGQTSRTRSVTDTSDLQTDGFTIRTDKKNLIIQGGSEKGVLYGVYTFFDKYLGYRCYSPTVFKYPTLSKVVIPSGIDDTEIPVNTYRNVFYAVANDPFYADWHKLDLMKPEWGMWVHTFSQLASPDSFFTKHPEYFALVHGERVGRQTETHLCAQLCLSNPDLLQTVVANLEKRMAEQPEALYWSVSQNDTYADQPYNCTCEACKALDQAAGAPSGSIITFANQVAERFPDKMISTLAYRYSRTAPKGIQPADNVNIMLCDIECNREKPIESDSTSASFRKDFEQWGQLAKSILMWDYIIQFSNLMAPYPNLRTLQPNMQYFVKNGVTAQFQQGNISQGGEFCELRPYLVARLLWNPDVDIQAELTDFLSGYYEEGAPYIAEYINLMHDELEKSGLPLTIYGKPMDHFEKGYMRTDLAVHYEQLFDEAEKAVAAKPEVLERVQVARMPLTFSLFEIAKARGRAEDRVFEQVDGKWQVRAEAYARLDALHKLCNKVGVQNFVEGGISPDDYYRATQDVLTALTQN